MIQVYRKLSDTWDLNWHFHTLCPQWPEVNYVQVRFVEPGGSERLCEECIRLEAEMFPAREW